MTITDYVDLKDVIEEIGSAKFIGSFKSGSPEWHAARAGIGGSDIGVIMGKSQFKALTLFGLKSQTCLMILLQLSLCD